ncbi:MAG: prepilin-type N-terminal cleavage/methylation domain-containing protein [Candidatus Sumerlaeaceae bacterium]|nr:prepilin-type N-terminal cleavage/methylation domain-containing protein [Candidatus Sumerlaeaceae bacterium]
MQRQSLGRMQVASQLAIGFTLIEALITIAILAIMTAGFFMSFVFIIRLERAVSEHEYVTAELLEFDRTWRNDFHGASDVRVSAQASEDAFTTTVTISYPATDSRNPCFYQISAHEKGKTTVVRGTAVASNHKPHLTLLLSNVQNVCYAHHQPYDVHELRFLCQSGLGTYHLRNQVRITASAKIPLVNPLWKEVHR